MMQPARDERRIVMLSHRAMVLSADFPRAFNKLGRFPPRDFAVTWEGISGRKSELCAQGHRTRQDQGPDQLVNAGPPIPPRQICGDVFLYFSVTDQGRPMASSVTGSHVATALFSCTSPVHFRGPLFAER